MSERVFAGRRAELKASFVAKRGYWSAFWDHLLTLDPDFFETYLRYSALPWERGTLPPKVKEFVYIAIDAATTHLYEPGLRIHIRNALGHGATPREMLEVIKVVSGLGIHTATVGMPILADALERAGRPLSREMDETRASLKRRFVETLGYWRPAWDDVLALKPEFFAVYLDLASSVHAPGGLAPKVIELMHVAACASVTHLHEPALRAHVERALALGATADEIVEVYELASVLGMHSCTFGVPILVDELARAGIAIETTP